MALFVLAVALLAWRWPIAALVVAGVGLEYLWCEWRDRCPTIVR